MANNEIAILVLVESSLQWNLQVLIGYLMQYRNPCFSGIFFAMKEPYNKNLTEDRSQSLF